MPNFLPVGQTNRVQVAMQVLLIVATEHLIKQFITFKESRRDISGFAAWRTQVGTWRSLSLDRSKRQDLRHLAKGDDCQRRG